jgi:hypothetical protein
VEKRIPKLLGFISNFQKTAQRKINRPKGEISPILVTLWESNIENIWLLLQNV